MSTGLTALAYAIWHSSYLGVLWALPCVLVRPGNARDGYLMASVALAGFFVCCLLAFFLEYDHLATASPLVSWQHPEAGITVGAAAIQRPDGARAVHGGLAQTGTLLLWGIGLSYMMLRLLVGGLQLRRLVHGSRPLPAKLEGIIEPLASNMAVGRRVRTLISASVDSPLSMGWLRPVIVLPLSCLSGLSGEMLRIAWLHEWAHIRRFDFLLNLAQRLIEAVLFYHPSTWWLSRRIRQSREDCVDDQVVHWIGSGRRYARTLLALEQRRLNHPSLAQPATGGVLMRRIKRLTCSKRPGRACRAAHWLPAIVVISAVSMLLVLTGAGQAQPGQTPDSTLAELQKEAHHPLPRSRLTLPFGKAIHPITGKVFQHRGIDWAARRGTTVLAPWTGQVLEARPDEGKPAGTILVMEHSGGVITRYHHLDNLLVEPGQEIHAGQAIAKVGNTGVSTGSHLHFEVHVGGLPVDPAACVPAPPQH